VQITKAARDAMFLNIKAAAGAWDPADTFIGIATAIASSGLDTLLADVTEPAGTVGDRVVLAAFGAPYTLINGDRVADTDAIEFRPASSADACVVVGYYLTDDLAAGILKGFEYFAAPIALPDENAAVTIVFRLTLSPAGTWSASVVIDG